MKSHVKTRFGFTIVELLMVFGVIGILMTIVTTAASSSMQMARKKKMDALFTVVQSGLATYYAQKDKWPVDLSESSADDDGNISLTDLQVRASVRALVDETIKQNPMLDISGLFVSRYPGKAKTGAAYGLDFVDAVHGTKRSKKKMKLAEMYYGYPEPEHGWFRHFAMTYNVTTDSIVVGRQSDDNK